MEWENIALTNKRAMILGSRDHAKTTFFSVLYPLYRAALDGWDSIIFSHAEGQVKEIVGKTKSLIDTSPFLTKLKPASQSDETWSKTDIRLSTGGRISGLGFGTSSRGRHPKLIVLDDPVKDFGGMSDEDQFRFYTNVIVPMCTPETQLLITSNRVKDGDLIDRLESEKIFAPHLFPAIKDNKALWPERWSLEALEGRRKEIGDFAFNREYLLMKVNPLTSFFKREHIQFYDDSKAMPRRLAKIMSIDPAITAQGDFTAIVVTGTDEENKTYVLDYANIKTDNIQTILDTLMNMAMLHRIVHLQMEAIGFQRLLKHWLDEEMRKRNYFFGVEEIKHHAKSKEARIMALQPRIQSGSLLFKPGQTEMLDQLLAFPNGKYDDLIDSLAMNVGKWLKPDQMVEEVPEGSFQWWMNQVNEPDDYRSRLFEDIGAS